MIKMHNGAKVVAADVSGSDMLRGTVLALSTDNEWVTWSVDSDGEAFHASAGRYFDGDEAEARADYDERRRS